MTKGNGPSGHQSAETGELKSLVRGLGVDLAGIADLRQLKELPIGLPVDAASFFGRFRRAIVMGVQFGKLGPSATGTDVSLFLERAALAVADRLERKKRSALIIHTEDEFDPVKRMGLVSLKVLAKAAGLGWQGRSLLIVSPRYGPVHRWIGVLTDLELYGGTVVPNQCGDCTLCIDKCPWGALKRVEFEDHPVSREDVLDIGACKGDDGCVRCLTVCPFNIGEV
jgi:epoxyqueuosine reductase